MTDTPEQPVPDTSQVRPEAGRVVLGISNRDAVNDLYGEFDRLQRFRLQVASEFYEKVSNAVSAGTALYEKLILLNGAIIALSITFIGSLSSRLASAHLAERPHLWMVAISWLLLIISVYCSYRVIIVRHSITYRLLASVSAEHTKYLYQHVEISLTRLGALLKGKVPIGSGNIEFSEFTAKAVKALEQEGEASVKRMEKFIEEGKKAYKEGLFAKLAVNCTILAIAILCAFTVVSLRLLF